jgi:hypothetical protein
MCVRLILVSHGQSAVAPHYHGFAWHCRFNLIDAVISLSTALYQLFDLLPLHTEPRIVGFTKLFCFCDSFLNRCALDAGGVGGSRCVYSSTKFTLSWAKP